VRSAGTMHLGEEGRGLKVYALTAHRLCDFGDRLVDGPHRDRGYLNEVVLGLVGGEFGAVRYPDGFSGMGGWPGGGTSAGYLVTDWACGGSAVHGRGWAGR
jgi:hypothetical protein